MLSRMPLRSGARALENLQFRAPAKFRCHELLYCSFDPNHSMKTTVEEISRRDAISRTGLLLGAALLSGPTVAAAEPTQTAPRPKQPPFRFCLNTATIRGQKLGLQKEIQVAAQSGYRAIEPWVETIEAFKQAGGDLLDIRKQLADSGLTVESAIGFAEWIVDDDAKRAKGLERAKYDMDLVAQIGGKRLAAPPSGATNTPGFDLLKAADRYRALLERQAIQIGIVPELELWGFSQNMHRLSECAMVAIQTGHPKACVLIDVFHIYKGGSDYRGLNLLNGNAVPVLHMNDYPAEPPVDKINDSFRCYPGDGVAPITEILQILHVHGGDKVLSLELSAGSTGNKIPWKLPKRVWPKMKAAVAPRHRDSMNQRRQLTH